MNQSGAVSITALKTFPLFAGLSEDVLISISQAAAMRRFPRGQVVVRIGEVCDFVYIILTGSLKVAVCDDSGREAILSVLGQGEVFGEMGMFDDQVRSASVVAITATDLVMISRQEFRLLMQEHFDISWRMMCSLAQRLRKADRKIESLALMDVYGRVVGLLIEMSEDVAGKRVVKTRISKQDIARMIGASREMVSRVMKDIVQQGQIEETQDGIVLSDHLAEF
ncbi:transcriptional regulator Crp [Betaproteobacteria bacterium]|nr:transcriptional regulator Crp [Betaproteobacteria bacterium]GHU09034.1 transcriptional regulator Crp [Betaproteobacteria bacterium]GHU16619.1 transcriptional regulator Crp [Betaproteobacteria bacterium]GHU30496.1 transcriptional regulator Crp [Betaproteobacteria bacterium]